ncbi:hypothetical protein AKJ09_11418 [Labilithrix luteola]|uniref:IgGFc-binding protein N-terminal domain-containing protein n=1 Tax=Labilithrix luteola TaxID=1391654 RepID=A0A0K1QH52_9BACT|nr:IgGFc-binding protein [Labilithrix luteola]AKV04755.1 hypothetical protein AKJ09_11418 [Labilithrix luteola]
MGLGSPNLCASILAFITATTLLAGACSSKDNGFSGPDVISLTPEGGAPIEPCKERQCSRDLKKVLSACDGGADVLEECGPDQGCGDGRCLDACESAKLSKGSIGCSFWTLPPDDAVYGGGSCFAAMVANTWDHDVRLTAEFGADPLDISRSIYTAEKSGEGTIYKPLTGALPPGQVALVFLSKDMGATDKDVSSCPDGVVPAVQVDPIHHGTTITRAFHLKADAPVAAYSIFPYGGAATMYPTATLLLPVSSWDTSYIAVSANKVTTTGVPGGEMRTLQIVANEDDTKVTMRPNVGIIQGERVPAAQVGSSPSFMLARGEVLQITQRDEATGTPIVADKPVGLFGGSPCTFLPAGSSACDMTQQQIAPFSQWGSEYALVPFASRITSLTATDPRELVPWSLVGSVAGTVLTYDPERPMGAPETLGAGEVATFFTDRLVVVKSQDASHPFHASVYMTGARFSGGLQGGSDLVGDPDFVGVVPSDQFLDRYIFFADYTYPETSLTIVRRKQGDRFLPVELDCAGEISDFAPLGTTGEYEFAWVHLTREFQPVSFAKGTCGYGRHEAHSDGPFSVTIWGTGSFASYGYNGGRGSRPINTAKPPIVN